MFRPLMLILAVSLMTASGATSQEPEPVTAYGTDAFNEFLDDYFMRRMRRETVQRSMALHLPECLYAPDLELLETTPLAPIRFAEGAQVPNEGTWQERVFSIACGETSTENMVHSFSSEGQQSFLLVRGRTRADVNTQLSMIDLAVATAMRDDAAEGCDIGRISDTYVTEEYSDGRWQERWEVRTCEHRVDLDITFDPDTDVGTTFAISVVE